MNGWKTVVLAVAVTATATPAGSVTRGKPAPPFSLRKLGGGRLGLRDLRGKTVLLSFWTAG